MDGWTEELGHRDPSLHGCSAKESGGCCRDPAMVPAWQQSPRQRERNDSFDACVLERGSRPNAGGGGGPGTFPRMGRQSAGWAEKQDVG